MAYHLTEHEGHSLLAPGCLFSSLALDPSFSGLALLLALWCPRMAVQPSVLPFQNLH